MPHLSFTNLSSENLKNLSKNLSPILSKTIGCPEDWLTFSSMDSICYTHGEQCDTSFVHVNWFARPQQIQDMTANILLTEVKKISNCEVIVIFHNIGDGCYYEG